MKNSTILALFFGVVMGYGLKNPYGVLAVTATAIWFGYWLRGRMTGRKPATTAAKTKPAPSPAAAVAKVQASPTPASLPAQIATDPALLQDLTLALKGLGVTSAKKIAKTAIENKPTADLTQLIAYGCNLCR